MMPYRWFLALEVSDSQDSFYKTRLPELGYLPNPPSANNPDSLRVGFVRDQNEITKEEFIGMNCAACHTNQISYAGKTYQIARDMLEAQNEKLKSYLKDLQATVEAFINRPETASVSAVAPPTLKYKAAPLTGIWATAPYLHNGSVPNLYELLLPSNQRTTRFYVGNKEFDPKNVGYKTDQTEATTLLDTSLPGNSNSGHDTYGVFTDEQFSRGDAPGFSQRQSPL